MVPREEGIIVTHHTQLVRSGLVGLALAVGLGGVMAGCGGPTGSGTGAESEKVPEGIAILKEAMKERAAAKKGGPSGSRRAPGRP